VSCEVATNANADKAESIVRSFAKLQATMRDDLEGKPFSTPEELEIALDKSPTMQQAKSAT
jgi:hypothetical protein